MGVIDGVRAIVLPARCAACWAWGRAPLCAACEACVRWIESDACGKCGRPAAVPVARCNDCRGRALSFDVARAAAAYDGPMREALKAFKLGGERRTAAAFARWMVPTSLSLGSASCVTWVPSTRRSDAERGFNPAEELARPLARALELPVRGLIAKIRETRDQSGLSRAERRANQTGAFTPRARAPARVLLVDDIMTTGATVDACAIALRRGGARRIAVVTLARAP